jgi:hypothetical protein
MPADIQEAAQDSVAAPHDYDWFAGNVSGDILASGFNLIETANEWP